MKIITSVNTLFCDEHLHTPHFLSDHDFRGIPFITESRDDNELTGENF